MTHPFFITAAKVGWRGAHDLQQEGVLSAGMKIAQNGSAVEPSRAQVPQAPSRGWSI